MKIIEISDPEFKSYGRIIEGYDISDILSVLESSTPLPEGCGYVPEEEALKELPSAQAFGKAAFGGLPVQFGWCNGHNNKLNCLEYHKSSELLLGTEDFILLLAKESEIENGKLDTKKVKAFLSPKGVAVELYATTLHFAPCHIDPEKGFRVLVILPKGTNTEKPSISKVTNEDKMLWANNKWLLAHPESDEAKLGAYIGLEGINIDVEDELKRYRRNIL